MTYEIQTGVLMVLIAVPFLALALAGVVAWRAQSTVERTRAFAAERENELFKENRQLRDDYLALVASVAPTPKSPRSIQPPRMPPAHVNGMPRPRGQNIMVGEDG